MIMSAGRLGCLAMAVATLITAAACGGAARNLSQSSTGAGGNVQARTPPTVHSVAVPTSSLPVLRQLGNGQAEKLQRLPWKFISTQNHGRELVIFVTTGCSQLVGAAVRETTHQVTIAALGTATSANQPCAGTGGGDLAKVRLPTPFDSRSLLHEN
jgi:hypothetical protein